jgi:hypothetical protein
LALKTGRKKVVEKMFSLPLTAGAATFIRRQRYPVGPLGAGPTPVDHRPGVESFEQRVLLSDSARESAIPSILFAGDRTAATADLQEAVGHVDLIEDDMGDLTGMDPSAGLQSVDWPRDQQPVACRVATARLSWRPWK